MKYFIHLSYHGGQYHGWQRQVNVISIQEVLETQLSRLLKQDITIIGCGRTDAGVHASQYYAHIKVDQELNETLRFKINKMLPTDIAVHEFIGVDSKAHAQHDATARTYTYHLHHEKNPLINQTSTEYDLSKLNINLMQLALRHLLSLKDFRYVCKHPDIYKTTICHVQSAELRLSTNGQNMEMVFTSNRYLRSMIRLLVTKILHVGVGKLTLEEFKEGFHSGFQYYDPAPAQGLWLTGVSYDFL